MWGGPSLYAHGPCALTPVWLVTTDNQCARATEQAQLWAEWVIMQVEASQPRPPGLPRGTALLAATRCRTTHTWRCTHWRTS